MEISTLGSTRLKYLCDILRRTCASVNEKVREREREREGERGTEFEERERDLIFKPDSRTTMRCWNSGLKFQLFSQIPGGHKIVIV